MHPQGEIKSAAEVADPTFGVHGNVLGLERSVEMLQWLKVDFPLPAHYERAWTSERIDASGFDATHKNPGDLPFNGERWWTTDPTLDGKPVSPDVLAKLETWTALKPDLSQLPANLAVSFQPDGDWLSTSQDFAHPQIGDVRVRWRTIERASAPVGAQLVAGRWELPAPGKAVAATPAVPARSTTKAPATGSNSDLQAWLRSVSSDDLLWLVVAGIVLAGLLLFRKRRRR